jgi:hypothetical protein
MAIIGTLPNNIQNGQSVDANPLMADFNFIVNQVNANANPIGTFTAPSGTTMAFQQASAPIGWTAVNTAAYQDAFLRTVTPVNFTGTGGTFGASNLFLNQIAVDPHILSVAEMPSHTHTVNDPTHNHVMPATTLYNIAVTTVATPGSLQVGTASGTVTASSATGITLQNQGGGTGHAHTYTANCKYVDQIIAVKT